MHIKGGIMTEVEKVLLKNQIVIIKNQLTMMDMISQMFTKEYSKEIKKATDSSRENLEKASAEIGE